MQVLRHTHHCSRLSWTPTLLSIYSYLSVCFHAAAAGGSPCVVLAQHGVCMCQLYWSVDRPAAVPTLKVKKASFKQHIPASAAGGSPSVVFAQRAHEDDGHQAQQYSTIVPLSSHSTLISLFGVYTAAADGSKCAVLVQHGCANVNFCIGLLTGCAYCSCAYFSCACSWLQAAYYASAAVAHRA
jgi:hypothetical protein